MHVLDWVVVVWVLLVVFGVAFAFRERASKSFDAFFLSGRSLPWWLLGTSMVATTFASDTPLAVTGLVGKNGIAGNWVWWSLLLGTTFTVYFFAGPWRRAAVTSDVELVELRYGSGAGSFLRGFRALYMSFLYVGIILGWVVGAMSMVLRVALDLEPGSELWLIGVLSLLAVAYTLLAGLWGVVATDLLQFVLAMGGSIALAVLAWSRIGGTAGMNERLVAKVGSEKATQMLAFWPSEANGWGGIGAAMFAFFVGVQWWATVYPGSEPGGGSFVAQRMLAARAPRDARLGTLLYAIAHFALRPWPWILVALYAVVVHIPAGLEGDALDKALKEAYPKAMIELLPAGLFGLLVASFFAAFMSTVDTLLTLAGSYLVNDLYRPFIAPGRDDKHYLAVSRVAIVVVMVVGASIGIALGDKGIDSAWKILIALGAGSGVVLIARWYWWRINAWSEIAAMLAAFVAACLIDPNLQDVLGISDPNTTESALPWFVVYGENASRADSPERLYKIIGTTTVVWVVATLLTKPVPRERLVAFYRRVRPSGAWGPVAAECPDTPRASSLVRDAASWIVSTLMIFAFLFAFGSLILGTWTETLLLAGTGVASAVMLWLLDRGRVD